MLGVLGGAHNGRGVSGICPGAALQGVSFFGEGWGTAAAIRKAADTLRAGDILLMEMMRAGPNAPRDATPDSQVGYIPLDYWPDDFAAIAYAVRRGVVVVAAAGNGAQDLDDRALRRLRRPRQPVRARRAGLGRDPRRRGRAAARHPRPLRAGPLADGLLQLRPRIDAQGWGREVATTGGLGRGPDALRPGPVEDRWYTDRFSGTSSAAPMVAGALACVQGVLRAAGRRPLTPGAGARRAARDRLRSSRRRRRAEPIGNRPDLGRADPVGDGAGRAARHRPHKPGGEA